VLIFYGISASWKDCRVDLLNNKQFYGIKNVPELHAMFLVKSFASCLALGNLPASNLHLNVHGL